MSIVKLKHRITFLENITKDEVQKPKWQVRFHSFAEIKPICDNRFLSLENINFGNVITEEYFVFRLRFSKNIHTNMRIKFNARLFEIKRIITVSPRDRLLTVVGLVISS